MRFVPLYYFQTYRLGNTAPQVFPIKRVHTERQQAFDGAQTKGARVFEKIDAGWQDLARLRVTRHQSNFRRERGTQRIANLTDYEQEPAKKEDVSALHFAVLILPTVGTLRAIQTILSGAAANGSVATRTYFYSQP